MRVSLVLPCHDEAGNLPALLGALEGEFHARHPEADAVVVDDGSGDGSGDLLRAAAARLPWLGVVAHDRRRGYGAALKSGFAAARGDWIAYMDSDGQFRVGDLLALIEGAEEGGATVGFRLHRRDPAMRRFLGWLWTAGMCVLFGFRVRDVDCGMKVFPRWLVEDPPLWATGAMISPEILVRARHAGLPVRETGVEHHPRLAGTSSGASPRVIARALREAAGLFLRLRTGRYRWPAHSGSGPGSGDPQDPARRE